MSEYLLPDVGEGLTEAEILTWRVAVGDVVAVNDIVVDIETAKSVVELPSPYAGEVLALLVNEGDTVQVGTPIIRIGSPSGVPQEPPRSGVTTPSAEIDLSNPAATGGGDGELLVGRVKEMGTRRRRSSSNAELRSPQTADTPGSSVHSPAPVRPMASPAVRRHARDLEVDLADVAATGPAGNVTHADLMTRPPSPSSTIEGRREPVRGLRRTMAQAMVTSAFTAPHVTTWLTVDATATMALIAQRRAQAKARLSPLSILAKACIEAIGREPIINSVWDGDDVIFKDAVNLGIATATPRGLMVPNIKHAQTLSLDQLSQAIAGLVEVAREGKTPPADNLGGTFSITNIGSLGLDGGTPIINPGESAIIGFGAIRRQPWVIAVDGEERLAIRDLCTLSLSFDHRHIDGETGARFLTDVAASLQDPTRLDLA